MIRYRSFNTELARRLIEVINKTTTNSLAPLWAIDPLDGWYAVDVYYYRVLVDERAARRWRAYVARLLTHYPASTLEQGVSLTEMSERLQHPDAAVRLFGLGAAYGFWQVRVPVHAQRFSPANISKLEAGDEILTTGFTPEVRDEDE